MVMHSSLFTRFDSVPAALTRSGRAPTTLLLERTQLGLLAVRRCHAVPHFDGLTEFSNAPSKTRLPTSRAQGRAAIPDILAVAHHHDVNVGSAVGPASERIGVA